MVGEREPGKEADRGEETILSHEFVEPVIAEAKDYLQSHGRLDPALLLIQLDNGERGVIQLSLPRTSEEKQNYFKALGLTIRLAGHRIHEALFISEVWYVAPEKPVAHIDIAPSQHPDRKEAILAVGRDALGERFTNVLQPFVRNAQNQLLFENPAFEEYNILVKEGHHPVGLVDFLFNPVLDDILNSGEGRE
jgi:hypothetical protein